MTASEPHTAMSVGSSKPRQGAATDILTALVDALGSRVRYVLVERKGELHLQAAS